MADCSSAGTTIDRAARAVLGTSNQQATKSLGALIGHSATVMTRHSAVGGMPMNAPEHLTLPAARLVGSATNTLEAPLAPAQSLPASSPQMMIPRQHTAPSMQHPHPQQFHLHHQHQQQAVAQAMFHQQQQIMQQQMQIMAAQQHQQQIAARIQQEQQYKQESSLKQPLSREISDVFNDNLHDDLYQWHDGLEEEYTKLQQEYYLDDDAHQQVGGDIAELDSDARGDTLQELASAWAQAEAEYEELEGQEFDMTNLFQSDNSAFLQETQPYEFINKMEEGINPLSKQNWMEKGVRFFHQGNLGEAIRAFEMELQQNNPDNATAWRMLGRCHAENDMDPEAIKCLEAAVDRDPYSPESLLALGVSYVNELNHEKALENMKAWFTHNPKYAGMNLPTDIYGAANSTGAKSMASGGAKESAFEEVKHLLLAALAFDATDAGDVHEALGVIYNVIKDYDAAADSFRKALESRPEDYQLWNKLGATLANGSQSDQALPAYHRALQIKPKYARAWLNMAISHSNLQDHDEAARCYLQTLSLNPKATHCWTYLRMALSCAEKWDLLPLVFSQDLTAFNEHYDFVTHDG